MLLGPRAPLAVANGHTQHVAARTAHKNLPFHCFIVGDIHTHTDKYTQPTTGQQVKLRVAKGSYIYTEARATELKQKGLCGYTKNVLTSQENVLGKNM